MSKIYSGKLKLPTSKKMKVVAKRDSDWWANYFKHTSHRLDGLVNIYIYSHDITKKCNMKPSYAKLFFKSPFKWWRAITSPYNNSRYLLNDEKYHDQIFDNMKQYRPHPFNLRFWFVHFLYFFFMIIRHFYGFFRGLYANKTTNSIIELDRDMDKEAHKRKIRNITLTIITFVLLIFIILVPEWRHIAIENIRKIMGPTDTLKDKRFITIFVIIILYLLYL